MKRNYQVRIPLSHVTLTVILDKSCDFMHLESKSQFSTIWSIHVYSVQKSKPEVKNRYHSIVLCLVLSPFLFPRILLFFIKLTTNVIKITSLHITNGILLTVQLLKCFDLINTLITETIPQLQLQVNIVLLFIILYI